MSEENSVDGFTPHPLPLTPHSRIRWDCRRGMLELDIVLARFMAQNFNRLTPQEVDAFKELLAYSDPDLWGLIQSGEIGVDDNERRVLLLLRQY
ncbi:MAG: succinate dehydrogenase assembly factor 2 [Gammaproteobacteria bacterium]|nr:succinate dehydrogenase assembly factor 2 [Gammaproteobacteria bacterium]MBU1980562.1 succinate dehydrogenase assembly factor 2 [Gammaproteobacteria bacterium]